MPKIKNERYLRHFKRGKIEPISPKEFYDNWKKIQAPYHLQNLLKDYFLLLYWTGRRPVEILDLKGKDFRQTTLKDKGGTWKDYLAIQTHTKKGGKEVEIFLVFEQIPELSKLWGRIQGCPNDFMVFWLLRTTQKQELKWITKDNIEKSKIYDRPSKKVFYWCIKYFGVPPYFFRHNRFSTMKIEGATFEDIKTFKGAKTLASVECYISPDEETLRELGGRLKY